MDPGSFTRDQAFCLAHARSCQALLDRAGQAMCRVGVEMLFALGWRFVVAYACSRIPAEYQCRHIAWWRACVYVAIRFIQFDGHQPGRSDAALLQRCLTTIDLLSVLHVMREHTIGPILALQLPRPRLHRLARVQLLIGGGS